MAKTSKKARSKKAQTGTQSVYITTNIGGDGTSTLDKLLPANYSHYRRIRKHPTVALARSLSIAPIVAGEWSVEADDGVEDERVRFIRKQLLAVREFLVQTIMEHRIDYGWVVFEKVFDLRKIDGADRIVIAKLKTLLVDLTEIRVETETGEFAGITQPSSLTSSKPVVLEVEDCLFVAWQVEGDNLYGRPLLENIRGIFQHWEGASAGAERYDAKMAGGLWIVHYCIGTSPLNGVEKDNAEIAKDILGALEASGGVVVPRKIQKQITALNETKGTEVWEIELKEHSGQQGAFVTRMEHCDKLFVRGLLAPERTLLEGEHGTKAEAGVHTSLVMTQRELEHRYIVRRVNEALVDHLLLLNWGPEAVGTIRVVAAPLQDAKLAFFQEVYMLLLAHPTASIDTIEGMDLDALTDAVGVAKETEVIDPETGKPLAGMDIGNRLAKGLAALYQAATG